MRLFLLTLSFLFAGTTLLAQDTGKASSLDELFVLSQKFAEQRKNIVQKTDVITAKTIERTNAQTTGDLLANTGTLFVQRSQQGGSSPVIRGFEASRVLLVVDGIRMNNAVYRAGHLQNVITVDQNMLDRVEVLYGPSSTIFGSDALGGVVHLISKRPQTSADGKLTVGGTSFIRYSSVNHEKTGHADVNLGWRKWAWLQSYNYSNFGDMRMGDNYPDKYPNFGRRSQYIDYINGVDSIVKNSDDRIQRFSGYKQWDFTQKVLFKPNAKFSHLVNLQYSNSTDVPRYDRLQDLRNGALRWAKWYYGPQTRALAAYELNIANAGFFDEVKAIVSYQYIKESRHQREYRRYDRLDNRIEKLNVWAATVDGRKKWGNNELTMGVDAQLNELTSKANRQNIQTGAEAKLDSRYPNGDNNLNSFGVYAQHILKLNNGRLVLNDGLRLQHSRLHSTIADNSFFNFPFTAITQNNKAITGNLGLAYMPAAQWRFTAGLATGFRSPNIDDLARIFESDPAGRRLIIPNPDVKPEKTYNADVSIAYNWNDRIRIEATGYYTWFRDAIAVSGFQLNGQDSVVYNGQKSRVYANRNVNKAYLYGFSSSLTANITDALQVQGSVNYTYGRQKPEAGGTIPLDHIAPVFGRASIGYTKSKWYAEAYLLFNGRKKIKDYNPSGEDNAQYATADGMPAWSTTNLRLSWKPLAQLELQAAVENIFDRNYRMFASGFSSGGRNVMLAVRFHM